MNIPDEVRQTIEDALHDAISVAEAYVEEGSWRAADMIVRYNAALDWLAQRWEPVPDGHLRVLLDFVETTLGDIMEVRKVREWLAAQPKQGEE